jgi:hypothetical protein
MRRRKIPWASSEGLAYYPRPPVSPLARRKTSVALLRKAGVPEKRKVFVPLFPRTPQSQASEYPARRAGASDAVGPAAPDPLEHRTRWGARTIPEKTSPGALLLLNPEAQSPGRLTFPPFSHKLTDSFNPVSRDLKEAVADFIRSHGPWGWLCHLTFNRDVLEKTAHHHFMRWIRSMNEELFGRYFREKQLGVTFARATEHQQNGRIHYHVLISEEVRRLRRLSYKDYWEHGFPKRSRTSSGFIELSIDPGNGFARVYDYNLRKAGLAEKYLVKYLTKERDIFLYRPLGHPDRRKSSK